MHISALPPTLLTPRLRLRGLTRADAPAMVALAGEKAVAEMTRLLPHPYLPEHAEQFLEMVEKQAAKGDLPPWAIALAESDVLIGTIGLRVALADRSAELGYWLGRPYWGKGYMSEAARAAIAHAFGPLELNRVWATCMTKNAGSRRVLEKAGLRLEGTLREHVCKWDVFEDVYFLGILRRDWKP
jgi:RimJ/RimL family protein N-acetyltransferase